MTKRNPGLPRKPRDFYATPPEAVEPLLPHLEPGTRFCEPCAGDGRLLTALVGDGHVCVGAWDVEPRRADIECYDALTRRHPWADVYITNPPWSRDVLHPLIRHLSAHRPTWLLMDADWAHTRQASEFKTVCAKIVSVGRVKWIEGSASVGFDNAAWYLFDSSLGSATALLGFYGFTKFFFR